MGANITPATMQRVSKCLGVLQSAIKSFDSTFAVGAPGDRHSPARREKDLQAMVEQLHSEDVFSIQDGREHNSFKSRKQALTNIDRVKVTDWLQRAVKRILEYQ